MGAALRDFIHTSNNRQVSGAMSVEASLAVPIMLFFIANLLNIFIMYEQYSINLAELHQQAKEMAMISHIQDGGGEVVHLKRNQSLSPLMGSIAYDSSYTSVGVNIRKWTGYDVLSVKEVMEDDEYVYITEYGSVYHRSRDCSHLRISIQVVSDAELSVMRNSDGGRYYPCDKCGRTNSSGLVFITQDGDRYHNNSGCSSLKRSIKVVKLSEVGGRGPCSSCG